MFDALVLLMLIVPFGFILLPWYADRWPRLGGIWAVAGLAIVILFFLPLPLLGLCEAANCGQGVLVLIPAIGAWIAAGVFTVISAAIAHFTIGKRSEPPHREPRGRDAPH